MGLADDDTRPGRDPDSGRHPSSGVVALVLAQACSLAWLPVAALLMRGYLADELSFAPCGLALGAFLLGVATALGLLLACDHTSDEARDPQAGPSVGSAAGGPRGSTPEVRREACDGGAGTCASNPPRRPPHVELRMPDVLACVFLLFGLACHAIAIVPTDVSTPLFALGSACLGVASGCGARMWKLAERSRPRKEAGAARVAAMLVDALLFASLPRLGTVGPLVVALVSGVVASLAAARVRAWPALGSPGGDPCAPVVPTTLLSATASRLKLRLFLSMLLVGASFGTMVLRFVVSPYDRVDGWVWLCCAGGTLAAGALMAFARTIHHESDHLFAWRLSMPLVLLAFFPVNPGTQFSLVLSLTWSCAAAWCFVTLAPLVEREVAEVTQGVGRDVAGLSDIGLACGAGLGCLVGALMGTIGSPSPLDAMSVVRISLAGMTCMVLTFVATNVLVEHNKLRELRFLRAGRLPLSYELVEGSVTDAAGEDGGRGDLLASCKRLAMEFGLTPRETEVLAILARGNSLAKVQSELFISEGTAITHRSSIYRKLGVHSKQELLELVGG